MLFVSIKINVPVTRNGAKRVKITRGKETTMFQNLIRGIHGLLGIRGIHHILIGKQLAEQQIHLIINQLNKMKVWR